MYLPKADNSAKWLFCHMMQKGKSVTLTSFSSPCGRYHNPRPEGPSNLRTLRSKGPVHLKNPHTEDVSKGGAAAIKNACHILMAGIWICCIISNGQNWDSSDSIWNVPFDFLIDIFDLSNGSKYFYGNKKKGSDRDALQCQSLFWLDRNNT